ncbi:MAG: 5'-methylthioadenosine/S-adenosylhomocysteine nucleosidase, partial [Treponema sp.]|nr:5'-methylthioadenosine/S-adenosylhomocysteine nucleosidase [Treponema sp.]
DETLAAAAEQAISELKHEGKLPAALNYCRGIIGSGDVFMHDPQRINVMRQIFPEIAAVEMESAAIAHCCHLFAIPVLVIRALSDIAGAESPLKFDEFLPVASKHSAEIVRRIISITLWQ